MFFPFFLLVVRFNRRHQQISFLVTRAHSLHSQSHIQTALCIRCCWPSFKDEKGEQISSLFFGDWFLFYWRITFVQTNRQMGSRKICWRWTIAAISGDNMNLKCSLCSFECCAMQFQYSWMLTRRRHRFFRLPCKCSRSLCSISVGRTDGQFFRLIFVAFHGVEKLGERKTKVEYSLRLLQRNEFLFWLDVDSLSECICVFATLLCCNKFHALRFIHGRIKRSQSGLAQRSSWVDISTRSHNTSIAETKWIGEAKYKKLTKRNECR